MDEKLKEQIEVIYECEKELEKDRDTHNYDLVKKDRILTEEELANHEIYLILKNVHK